MSKCSRFFVGLGMSGGPLQVIIDPVRPFGPGADRGLIVLIPHQRPTEGFAPEVAGLPGAVAVHRSSRGPSEEVVARLEDAELVALRVRQDNMVLVGALTDIHVGRTDLQEPGDGVV